MIAVYKGVNCIEIKIYLPFLKIKSLIGKNDKYMVIKQISFEYFAIYFLSNINYLVAITIFFNKTKLCLYIVV